MGSQVNGNHKPIPANSLRRSCNPEQFNFTSTAELPDLEEIIGQERAIAAIQFGIGINHEGFNLFALGPNGTGKLTAVRQYLGSKAATKPTPSDWCYIYNFDEPHRPRTLSLPAGLGMVLNADMQTLVTDLRTVIQSAFTSEEYQAQRKVIQEEFNQREIKTLETLKSQAAEQGIALIRTPTGFAFAPIKDENVISPEEFLQLSAEKQREIESHVQDMQEKLLVIMRQLPQWQRELQQRLKALNDEVAGVTIRPLFDELHEKYKKLEDVRRYLNTVQKDVIQNASEFLATDEPQSATSPDEEPFEIRQRPFARYEVNVIINHSQTEGAPVVYEDRPTYNNLIGRTEHISRMGTLFTDFTLIKPGVLHKANGGYLILDVLKLLTQPYAWEGLKHAIRAQEIRIESLAQMISAISTVSLEPEPIPLDIKVVLMGNRRLYYLLHEHDPDFAELFKVVADFEDEMLRSEENNLAYAQLIATLARKENLKHFSKEAVAAIIEQSARLSGDASRLSTHMQSISDLLREASYWATEANQELVTEVEVKKALEAQIYRQDRIHKRMQETILRKTIFIDTSGAVVGQVNGLAVYSLGNYNFGKPSRITARVRLGKGEVIDIERQVEMGGPIHSKGVLILSSYLGARYAAERPLSLSASLVFEQSYSGVEGDSASCAELYALLSALADVPIKQSLAVTGSVNQLGQVQAIGGVNEKIEGFFDLCQASELSGEQGVLIPQANVKHLMLREDVVDAVANGRFHIYAVETIDQGIEILTGMTAGKLNKSGNYPKNSINGRVVGRLEKLAETQRDFASPPEKS
jgi:lon-related putative ATP-dependent protease